MDAITTRGPDVTVLTSSPNPKKGLWACQLHSASARAWVYTYLKGVQRSSDTDRDSAQIEGDVLYLPDELCVKVYLDAFRSYNPSAYIKNTQSRLRWV